MHEELNIKPRSARGARRFRYVRILLVTAAVGVVTACSTDRMTGPGVDVERRDGLLGSLLGTVTGLLTDVTTVLRLTPVTQEVAVSKTFTAAGGELHIPELGFSLIVPRNAIPGKSLQITVTALPGKAVAYDFAPHGTKFRQPLTFRQDLSGTDGLLGALVRPELEGGYFKSNTQVNGATGAAAVDETIPLTVNGKFVTFEISHFSGYLVSTGRSSSRDSREAY